MVPCHTSLRNFCENPILYGNWNKYDLDDSFTYMVHTNSSNIESIMFFNPDLNDRHPRTAKCKVCKLLYNNFSGTKRLAKKIKLINGALQLHGKLSMT